MRLYTYNGHFNIAIVGAVYIDDCDYERLIPIYLIVSGCSSFLLSFLAGLKPKKEEGQTEAKTKPTNKILSAIGVLAGVFSFVWLICGKEY